MGQRQQAKAAETKNQTTGRTKAVTLDLVATEAEEWEGGVAAGTA